MITKKIKTIFKVQVVFILCFTVNASAQTSSQDYYDDDYLLFESYLLYMNSTAISPNSLVMTTSDYAAEPLPYNSTVALTPVPTPIVPESWTQPPSVEPTPIVPDVGIPPLPPPGPTPVIPSNETPELPLEPTPVMPDNGNPPSSEGPTLADPDDGTPPLPPPGDGTPPPPVEVPDGWTPPTPVVPEPPTPPPTEPECYQTANDDYTRCEQTAYRDRQRLLPDADMNQAQLRNIQMLNQISVCANERLTQQMICYCIAYPSMPGCSGLDIARTACITSAYTNYENCQRLAATAQAAQACEAMKTEDLANCENSGT